MRDLIKKWKGKMRSFYLDVLFGTRFKYLKFVFVIFSILFPMTSLSAGLIPCGGNGEPLCDFNQFAILVNKVINWFLSISASVAAVTFALAGAKMLFNPNNPSERQKALEMFKKTVIGLLVVLGAWLIVRTVISTLVDPSVGALRFFK